MGSNTQPGRKDEFSPENIAESPAFEPPRPRRSRPAKTAILAYVAIMLALYACFRVFMLLNNESLPAGSNALPTRPAGEESSLELIGEPDRDLK